MNPAQEFLFVIHSLTLSSAVTHHEPRSTVCPGGGVSNAFLTMVQVYCDRSKRKLRLSGIRELRCSLLQGIKDPTAEKGPFTPQLSPRLQELPV
jgi:hypothetical protein